MTTVDMARLTKSLRQIKEEPDGDITQRDINPYLLERVILPFLCGVNVSLDSLDFSAFTTDDIIDASREIDEVENGASRVGGVAQFFMKAPPTAQKTKAFC